MPSDQSSGSRPVLEFSLPGLDGQVISSSELRGRVTVLLFLTTFDVASQEQARRLEDVFHSHAPRINALGVIVEPPRYVDLGRAFRESLGLSYPLVMAERQLLDAHAHLKMVRSVPAWIVLDARGRVVWSAADRVTLDLIESALARADSP